MRCRLVFRWKISEHPIDLTHFVDLTWSTKWISNFKIITVWNQWQWQFWRWQQRILLELSGIFLAHVMDFFVFPSVKDVRMSEHFLDHLEFLDIHNCTTRLPTHTALELTQEFIFVYMIFFVFLWSWPHHCCGGDKNVCVFNKAFMYSLKRLRHGKYLWRMIDYFLTCHVRNMKNSLQLQKQGGQIVVQLVSSLSGVIIFSLRNRSWSVGIPTRNRVINIKVSSACLWDTVMFCWYIIITKV